MLEYELPAGALGPQEPAVTAELEVQQGDEERPVRLVLSPTQRPLALMTIPVVQAEGELPRPLGIISALLPPLGEGCEDGEAAQQQDEADEDEELSGEPGSGGSSEGEEMRAAPAAARGEEEEEGAHGESSEMSGELEGEAGEGSEERDDMEVDEDNPPDSPTSSLDGGWGPWDQPTAPAELPPPLLRRRWCCCSVCCQRVCVPVQLTDLQAPLPPVQCWTRAWRTRCWGCPTRCRPCWSSTRSSSRSTRARRRLPQVRRSERWCGGMSS